MLDPSKPIWTRRWFQVLLGLLLILAVGSFVLPLVLWVIYATRSVLLPVLVALVLAYAVEPWVRWLEQRGRIPRPISAVGLIAGLLALLTGLILYLGPQLARQIKDLVGWFQVTFPAKLRQFVEWSSVNVELWSKRLEDLIRRSAQSEPADSAAAPSGASPPGTPDAAAGPTAGPTATSDSTQPPPADPATGAGTQPAPSAAEGPAPLSEAGETPGAFTRLAENVDFRTITATIFDWLDVGYEVIASTIGFATYVTVAVAIIGFCFYFFVCKFPHMQRWCVPFIPQSRREDVLRVLSMMDESVSAFIRGRLVQALVIAVVLSTGWWAVGVPYWLLLGICGGLLNLIPYAAVIVWPLALILTGARVFAIDEPAFGLSFWFVFFWPTVIYLLAQGLDGWVIEPLVQGKATNLEPVTVLLAVLVGGSLAGLLGMLIAIPAAACIRILAREVVLPRCRQWAQEM